MRFVESERETKEICPHHCLTSFSPFRPKFIYHTNKSKGDFFQEMEDNLSSKRQRKRFQWQETSPFFSVNVKFTSLRRSALRKFVHGKNRNLIALCPKKIGPDRNCPFTIHGLGKRGRKIAVPLRMSRLYCTLICTYTAATFSILLLQNMH